MKHPNFWGVLAAGGQRGEGLILYLLNRNKAVFSMTTEEKEELQNQLNELKVEGAE